MNETMVNSSAKTKAGFFGIHLLQASFRPVDDNSPIDSCEGGRDPVGKSPSAGEQKRRGAADTAL